MTPVDLDGEGSPEYLVAKAVVDLPESGDYTAVGTLLNPATGAAVAQTTGRVEMDRGEDVFSIGFWGPDIRKAEVSGPYTLRLKARHRNGALIRRAARRRLFRRFRQAAAWCWGVGDDVEIVGCGSHDGGSSFC